MAIQVRGARVVIRTREDTSPHFQGKNSVSTNYYQRFKAGLQFCDFIGAPGTLICTPTISLFIHVAYQSATYVAVNDHLGAILHVVRLGGWNPCSQTCLNSLSPPPTSLSLSLSLLLTCTLVLSPGPFSRESKPHPGNTSRPYFRSLMFTSWHPVGVSHFRECLCGGLARWERGVFFPSVVMHGGPQGQHSYVGNPKVTGFMILQTYHSKTVCTSGPTDGAHMFSTRFLCPGETILAHYPPLKHVG